MKTLKNILLVVLCIALHDIAFSQVKFAKAYGGTGYDYGYSVKQTFDNGYIVAGSTTSYGYGASDAFLVKIDSFGYQLWHREYGGINIDKAYSIKETSDSGLVVVGYTNSFGHGGYDIYLIKTNKVGDTIWTKTLGGVDWDFGFSIDVTSDGGYIVAGGTYSYGSGNEDMYLLKLDSSGDTVWTKTFGGINDDEAKSVKQTSDGGYIVMGNTKSYGDSDGDFLIIKTNSIGDTLWTKKYGGTLMEETGEIIEAANGDFIFTGGTLSYGTGERVYVARTSPIGDSLWSRVYGGPNYTYSASVVETSIGRIVFANTTANSGAGLKDAAAFVADQDGWFINNTSYGSPSNDEVFSISKCRDNGYILCGYTEGYGSIFSNFYVIKTDSLGASAPFTTSVFEVDRATSSFTIYPNPAKSYGEITLAFNDDVNFTGNCELILTDISGKVLQKIDVGLINTTVSFLLNDIKSGVYFITVKNEDSILGHVKFVSLK